MTRLTSSDAPRNGIPMPQPQAARLRYRRALAPPSGLRYTTYLSARDYVDLLMDTTLKRNMIEASQNHTETH
jgi:hypothetical protein